MSKKILFKVEVINDGDRCIILSYNTIQSVSNYPILPTTCQLGIQCPSKMTFDFIENFTKNSLISLKKSLSSGFLLYHL